MARDPSDCVATDTAASARGTGVGSALLASRLARIDAEGAPAYIEYSNERNRRLYAREGFQEVAPIEGVVGARPMAMWRPPVLPGQVRRHLTRSVT